MIRIAIDVALPFVSIPIRATTFQFSGGELHTKVDLSFTSLIHKPQNVQVLARIQSPSDLIELGMVSEVLTRKGLRKSLILPYIPYARQDRVTEENVAFSLDVFVRILETYKYKDITVVDPHSDVSVALLRRQHRVNIITQADILDQHKSMFNRPLIIAPDAGAAKKAGDVAKTLNCSLITATKIRDVKTGKILLTEVNCPEVDEALVVDDICDGGITFVELAKLVRPKVKKLSLYVTHGIFSKGTYELRKYYDEIYTTDTFVSDADVTILKILEI